MLTKKRARPILALSIIVIIFQLFGSLVFAAIQPLPAVVPCAEPKAAENFIYDEYVVINPQNIIIESVKANINLLDFKHIKKTFPLPAEKYNRQKHFGGWIHFANDGTCFDTRGIVLERDSLSTVDISNCRIIGGDWFDHYTDKNYRSSSDIQIDHVVALKHTYMTGGFEWNNKKRCQYANHLGNKFHLLSVNGSENMRKGDRGPHEYMPPNQKYACDYIKNWLYIKYIWELRLTPTEARSIQTMVANEHCDINNFKIADSEMIDQKKYIKDNENICVGAALTAF